VTPLTDPSASVTGAAVFVTVDTAGVTTLVTGDAGLAAESVPEATALVAGARDFVTVDRTGTATLLAGARA
jgi:hypothetical protein